MMKLALTLEADSVNVRALNMGRIVVDIDGVNLAELINNVAENGYSLRVVDDPDQQSTCTPPPFTTLRGCRTISTANRGLSLTTMRIKRIRQHCCPVSNRPRRMSVPCVTCNSFT